MRIVPPERHLLRAKDLADARYFEPLDVDALAGAAGLSARPQRSTFREDTAGPSLASKPHSLETGRTDD